MLLKDTFEKEIDRPIDPVVKASQTDDAHLANELDEFVVTNEVKQHLLDFLDAYNDPDSVGNGAWISGFFGSGKSHLLKILAVALENRDVEDKDGTVKPALNYLIPKVSDMPALKSAMEVVPKRHPSESILFNIDAVAPNGKNSETGALLSAFIKVFNHHCGYYDGSFEHIAQLEYDLDVAGKLDAFRKAVEARVEGKTWNDIRKSALIYRKQISAAFDEAMGNPEGYTTDVVEDYKQSYKPDIHSFAERVEEYIESKHQKGFRVNFFVDEVGQFIAQNTNMMVNLQTIAEELYRVCGGNSWIIVTSQENMEDIVGQMKSTSANDFTKIQARFLVKMPLTSSDAKEVIRDRLLAKKEEDKVEFEALYEKYHNDFGMLFDFADGAKNYKYYQNVDEFCSIYPFVPYQFEIFMNAIRGLSNQNCFTGKYNSTGARSMLGVFQDVAERICEEGANTEDGTLVPFDYMFEGLRNSLRGEVYADISTAESQLNDKIAVRLLKALLLVKFVDDFRATPANLRVLLFGALNQNTSVLNDKIQSALDELERQVYVRRNGNAYEYLTNDEKEVEQEINNLMLPDKDIQDKIADIFRDVCGASKITYKSANGAFEHSYNYNLKIDETSRGQQRYDLTLDLVTDYEPDGLLTEVPTPPKTLTVTLRNARDFLHDVGIFVKTDRYARVNSGVSDAKRGIIEAKQRANSKLYDRLRDQLRELLTHASYNAGGVDISAQIIGSGKDAVNSALLELVRRSYTGLQQITRSYTDKDVYSQCVNGQLSMGSALEDYCQSVLSRIRMTPGTVTIAGDGMGSLIAWFSKNDFGWPEIAVRSAIAKLYTANKIEVRKAGQPLEKTRLAEALKRKQDLDKLTVSIIEEVSPQQLSILNQAFRTYAGTNPKELVAKSIAAELASYAQGVAEDAEKVEFSVRKYPFAERFEDDLKKVKECAAKAEDRKWVVNDFPKSVDELAAAKDDLTKMTAFCKGSPMQKHWEELRSFLENEVPRLRELGIDEEDLEKVQGVVADSECYRSSNIPAAYKTMRAIRARAQEAVDELREQALADLGTLKASYTNSYDLESLSQESREQFESIFQTAAEQLKGETAPYVIRNFVNSFNDRQAGRLIGILNPPKPVPAVENPPVGPEPDVPPVNPAPPVSPQPRTVSVRELKTAGFGRPLIENAEDADAYLAALKSAILKALAEGEKITVTL